MRAMGRNFNGLSMNYLLVIPNMDFTTRGNGVGRHAKSLILVKLPASTVGVASFGPSRELPEIRRQKTVSLSPK